MYNFCTLFDSNYLTYGLAMYESLKKHCNNYHLYIFPFDNLSYEVLDSLKLDNVTLISLEEFEDEKLLSVKATRTKGEYCWTCTPSTLHYVLTNFNVDSCTYIDADLYFYSSPQILIDEARNKSVIITDHRYTKKYDLSKTNGKYCVQFLYIKNDEKGLKVLNWWREACIDWCYNRFEEGKFGDQKYLDVWPSKFDGIHELINLGGGVAPWNVQQYSFFIEHNKIFGIEKKTSQGFTLIFFHFHAFKLYYNDLIQLGIYKLSNQVLDIIYSPYIKHIITIQNRLLSEYGILGSEIKSKTYSISDLLACIRQFKPLNYNFYKLSKWLK